MTEIVEAIVCQDPRMGDAGQVDKRARLALGGGSAHGWRRAEREARMAGA